MKKTYEKVEMEIFLFKKEDAVVASAILPVNHEHDNGYVDFNSFFEN